MNDNLYPIQFDVYNSSWRFGLDIRMVQKKEGKIYLAQPVTMVEHKDGESANATMNLMKNESTALMDALWRAGVRPSNGEGNVGMIGAMKEHMADLRKEIEFDRKMIEAKEMNHAG